MPVDNLSVPDGSVPIPFAPGYRICDGGVVWSCLSKKGTMDAPWHIRHPVTRRTRSGHVEIELQVNRNPWRTGLHQLVMLVFKGPCPPGLEVCHNDGNPENNFVANLRYGTHQSNVDDREKHGRTVHGERTNTAKLKGEDIENAFQMSEQGFTQFEIAEALGVTQTNVSQILKRQSWRRVDLESGLKGNTGYAFGERSGQAKLTAEKVVEIFRLSHSGLSQSKIAEKVGVASSNVCLILNRKTWRHVVVPQEFLPSPR